MGVACPGDVGALPPEWNGARDEGDVRLENGEERLLGDGWRRRSHWDRLPEGWGEMVTLKQRRLAMQGWAQQWLDAVLLFSFGVKLDQSECAGCAAAVGAGVIGWG